MAKKTAKKRAKKGGIVEWVTIPSPYVHVCLNRSSRTRPPWRAPPPEIIGMILRFLATDEASLRACSQAAREFRYAALSCLGRHLTVGVVDRVKECAQLVAGGAFQHIRSLDLGINDGRAALESYWKDYLIILGEFARYRTLDCLWLSGVPFNFFQPDQKDLRKTVTALGSTVTELGLYGCRFSSYEEMVSLIRSFPHCNSLFLSDCVTRRKSAVENAFAGLPEHTLSVKDLQLSSSFSNGTLIDISKLIEDAALDVGSLTSLVCDVGTTEKTQRIAEAVSESPVEQFQVACAEPGGFQGGRAPFNSNDNESNIVSKYSWVICQRSGP